MARSKWPTQTFCEGPRWQCRWYDKSEDSIPKLVADAFGRTEGIDAKDLGQCVHSILQERKALMQKTLAIGKASKHSAYTVGRMSMQRIQSYPRAFVSESQWLDDSAMVRS